MLQAYIDGYQERLFDQQCLAIHQGYWAGYFQSKKPKSANYILEKTVRDHQRFIMRKKRNIMDIPRPAVDVDTFIRREKKRKAYIANKSSK